MALTYSATLQGQIANRVFRTAYATLETRDKDLIDGSWTTGAPGGAAGAALEELRPTAQYLDVVGSGDIPSEFQTWFLDVAVLRCATDIGDDGNRLATLTRQVSRSRVNAVQYFARLPLSDTTGEGLSLTRANLVLFVVQSMFRGSKLVAPPVEIIDTAIRDTLTHIWMAGKWSFVRTPATMTLATDGSVSFSGMPGGAAFGFSLLGRWRYTSSAGSVLPFWLEGGTATQMAQAKAASLSAGRPSLIRQTRYGNTDRFELDRTPDQEYTLKGEVRIDTPALTTVDELNTALGLFPPEFHEIIRMQVLARCEERSPDTVGQGMRRRQMAEDLLVGVGPRYDDAGALDEVSDAPVGGVAGTEHPDDAYMGPIDGFGQIGSGL